MEKVKKIDLLNKLVGINNDRIDGLTAASEKIAEPYLKTLLVQYAHRSEKFILDLSNEIYRLGGSPREMYRIFGKFFRIWLNVESILAENDRDAILNSCEYIEQHVVDTYEKVLKDDLEQLSFEEIIMIKSQFILLKSDYTRFKSILEALVV